MSQNTKNSGLISQASLVFSRKSKLSDDYKIVKKLGAGAYSEVFLIEDKVKQNLDCVKVIDKESLSGYDGEDIMNEIKTLSEMDHPNIMKIKGHYDTKSQLMIVSEYLSGGELFDRIIEEKKLTEAKAAQMIEQIISAVSYLHQHGIIHRDLKPENIVFEDKNPTSNVKIIDFGTSRKFKVGEKLQSKMGTVYYIAPEVIEGSYNFKCDVWSCGVIFYTLLFGIPPFNSKSDSEIYEKIKKGVFSFPEKISSISAEAKDLITKMLTLNPDKRLTADECLSHPWFEKMRAKSSDLDNNLGTMQNLVKFQTTSQFQKGVLLYFVSYFDFKEEKQKLLNIFKTLDKNHDGQLDRNEILEACKAVSKNPGVETIVENIFNTADVNKTDKIDFTEFLLAATGYHKLVHDKELKQMFNTIDKNKDSSLSKEEIGEFFKLAGTENTNQLQALIKEVDKNNDGIISYQEFVDMMSSCLTA